MSKVWIGPLTYPGEATVIPAEDPDVVRMRNLQTTNPWRDLGRGSAAKRLSQATQSEEGSGVFRG